VSFERPFALVALAALPLLVGFWLAHDGKRREAAARFTNLALLPNLLPARPGRRRYVPPAFFLLALLLLVLGMARPHLKISVPRHEATVVLAIDISRSMSANDVQPTRLLAAENAASTFLTEIPKTYSVALVAFGSRAYVAVPPTQDRALVQTALNDLHQGEGTAIGDAIRISSRLGLTERASDGTTPPTSVLLISDGARDGGRTSPIAAARAAKKLHVPVSTVLLGTSGGVVTAQLVGGYTEKIKVPPSPGTLQSVANLSGGEFFRARTKAALTSVYKHLGTRVGHRTEKREIGDALAGGAIVLLLAGGAASAFWFRRVP
jgi:Ca-activated chloride channel family protein